MELLLTPGPVMIPNEIMQAMAQSNIHHRTKEFEALFSETLNLYQQLINCECRPILLASSGTGGMEAALRNVTSPNDKLLVLQAGKFAERWTSIGKVLDLQVAELVKPWGETFNEPELINFLAQQQETHVVCLQYCETSTTALHDVPDIARIVKSQIPNALLVVDAITAVGALAIDQQAAEIDVLIAGSQKALMLPPGVALISFNQRALDRFQTTPSRSLYFDLSREYREHMKNTTAFTPPISLVFGLHKSLQLINSEGAAQVYERHQTVSNYLRTELQNLGFELLAKDCPAPSVTGAFPPNGVNADKLRQELLKQAGIRIAGGQDQFKGRIIRIGHMGQVNLGHARQLVTALQAIV